MGGAVATHWATVKRAYPTDAAVQVANFSQNSDLLIGTKARITGLSLRATGADKWPAGALTLHTRFRSAAARGPLAGLGRVGSWRGGAAGLASDPQRFLVGA